MPLTFNYKLDNFQISPQYINCSAFILPRVIECRVYYIKPPAMTHFQGTISQGAVHPGPGHRRLRVADSRAVKSSSLVLSHCLCVRRYKHYRKRNRFSRISLQSHHPSGSHCSCEVIVTFQLQALHYLNTGRYYSIFKMNLDMDFREMKIS